MLEVKKLSPTSLIANLSKFLLFDGFLDLNNFRLSNFLVFGFTGFDLSSPSILLISLMANTLALSTSLAVSTCNDIVIFSIDMSGAAILLNL